MEAEKYIQSHDAFLFELDNVLYPLKDFHLQVYYLFSQFMEYSEQMDATAMLTAIQAHYAADGHDGVFEKTASQFGIPEKYKLNYDLLQRNIRLPLKLLLFDHVLRFMKAVVAAGKPLFLLVSGNPEAQLNKIKQVEWQGLEQSLIVYFVEELDNGLGDKGLTYLVDRHQLDNQQLLLIGHQEFKVLEKPDLKLTFLSADQLFSVI